MSAIPERSPNHPQAGKQCVIIDNIIHGVMFDAWLSHHVFIVHVCPVRVQL